jgi:hypothetical protein
MLIKCNLIIIIIYLKNFTTEVKYYLMFAAAAVETLPGVTTGREKGVRAGSLYKLDAARSNQNKLLLHLLNLPGSILLKPPEPSKLHLLIVMKKDTYADIFARRLLKTK